MADRWAVANGNWSNTATWNGGTLPTAADDVFADGFTVTINQNVTVLSVRNTQRTGGTNGGGFTLNSGVVLTANVFSGTVTCITFASISPNSATIIGNITGPTGNIVGVSNTSSGTLYITGNINASSGTYGVGVRNNAVNGTLHITGNVTGGSVNRTQAVTNNGLTTILGNCIGGSSGARGWAVENSITGTLYVTGNSQGTTPYSPGIWNLGTLFMTGNALAGSGRQSTGIDNSGTATITGDVTGGQNHGEAYGVSNSGTLSVVGTATGGTAAAGIANLSTGTVNLTRAKGNGFGLGSSGLGATNGIISGQSSITNVQEIEYGDLGQSPTSGPIRLTDVTTNKAIFYRPSLTKKTLVDQAASGGMPSASNVRSGTSFNFGNTTGTLAVPAANQVAVGVAVDNTVGTAVLTVANVQSILNASIVPAAIIERSKSNTQPINFAWPTTGATITATVSINNGNFVSTVGTVSFLRTETTGKNIYSLSYNAADRPGSEGQARYVLTDGSHTRSFTLQITKPSLDQTEVKSAVYNAMPNEGWVNGSYGDRFLISHTNQRTVSVTGSHHIAADIHELQPAVIDNTHFATGAIDSNALSTNAATEISSTLLNTVVENGLTILECIKLANAVLHGAASAMDSNPIFKSLDGTKNRVVGTITGFDRTISSRDGS